MSIEQSGVLPSMTSVDRAISEWRRGGFVVIEGDGEATLSQAAETVTGESLATLTRIGNGQTRLALSAVRAAALAAPVNGVQAISLPLDAAVSVGIIRSLTDPTVSAADGEASALSSRSVLDGSSSVAAIRLAKLAHLLPAAITAPFADQCVQVNGSDAASLPRVAVQAIADYPRLAATTLMPVAEARVPLAGAENTRIVSFRSANGGLEQLAIVVGEPERHLPAMCRLHSACFTGDLLGSLRCDCGPQLQSAIREMGRVGHGVVLYLAEEGRGIGLINKLRAYQLQDRGFDTVDANQLLGFEPDERSFLAAAVMLRHLNIREVRLMTNNPVKVQALREAGIAVNQRIPHAMPPNPHNHTYLRTKAARSGHLL